MGLPDKGKRLSKLRSDLKSADQQIARLYFSRSVFEKLVGIVNANRRLHRSNRFFTWLFAGYAESASLTIRRLLDKGREKDRESASLATIALRLCEEPGLITRQEYVGDFTRNVKVQEARAVSPAGTEAFRQAVTRHREQKGSELYGAFGCDETGNLCPTKLQGLLDDAERKCEKIRRYVNKRVAHYSSKPPRTIPTWEDLDDAIDAVSALFQALHLLLTGSRHDLTWTWQGDNWEWVFEEPWMAGGGHGPQGQELD